MGYREEAIECVKDHVLLLHKQIYAKYGGDFDRIYSEGYNSKSYQGRVIESGNEYELSYLECSCPKVKCGLRSNPEQCLEQREPPSLFGWPSRDRQRHSQCECSRQSILYILSQLEPDSQFEVRIENTILRGGDRCTFRITRRAGMKRLIAICGLDCEKCDAYIATKNDDQALREKTAKLWSELNNAPILPEHINCDGCRMNGRKTVFCDRLCQIRQCAISKGFETCGDCPEKETCSKVGAIWQHNPQAKENLEG